MRSTLALSTLALLGASSFAQEPVLDRGEARAVLRRFAGTWEVDHRTRTPEGETSSRGIDRVRALHDGAWMWSDYASREAQPGFEGHLLLGWNADTEQFVSCWIDSASTRPTLARGSWDTERTALVMQGRLALPDGQEHPHRVEMRFEANGHRTDTFWLLGEGGESELLMRSECARVAGERADALPSFAPLKGEVAAPLAPYVGGWQGEIEILAAGQPVPGRVSERQRALCGGRWLWGTLDLEIGGAPSVLHCVHGYDPAREEFFALWIDGAGEHFDPGRGGLDAEGVRQLAGMGVDELGRPAPWTESTEWVSADRRLVRWSLDAEDDVYDLQSRTELVRQP